MDNELLHPSLRDDERVVTLDQARASGLSAQDVARLVWSGRWRRVAHHTYLVPGRCPRP